MLLTSLDNRNKAIIFGIARIPVDKSTNSHTKSASVKQPTTNDASTIALNIFIVVDLPLKTNFTFDSAKKYHPNIVVSEKNDKHIDKNIAPNVPNPAIKPF